jgi:kynurenine aminotransferase
MNFGPPQWVTDAANEALAAIAPNHYSHPKGRIRLREAIKNFYGPQFGRNLDVESEILVTSGANEGEPSEISEQHQFIDIPRAIFGFHRILGSGR